MDRTKWLLAICAFIMGVSLFFSAGSFILLLNMERETERYEDVSEEMWEEVGDDVTLVKQTLASILEKVESLKSSNQSPTDTETGVLFDRLCIRESGGKIGVFTEDGILIRTIDVNVHTLPDSDRQALSEGITINSWRELIDLIEDFE